MFSTRYSDFRGLPKITVSNKVLRDKAFNIDKEAELDRYQRQLASKICKIKSLQILMVLCMIIMPNQQSTMNYKNSLKSFEK